MPIYRFEGPAGPDPDPIELRDADAAWSEAVQLCGAMMQDEDGRLPSPTDWLLRVFDENNDEIIVIEIKASRRSSVP